jgi:prepilin-type N-terminal cleavage/methylation domain-containing protein
MRILRFQPLDRPASNPDQASGFTLIEILVAVTILIVGLSALGALVAQTLSGTDRARYLSLATTLASEKLEDLNRWRAIDAHVAAGGSLAADSASGTLDYYDDIDLSNTTGQVSETVASTSGSSTTYSNVIHNSTGYINTTAATAPPTGSGVISFHRRWLIEANPVVNGVTLTGSRRVTVLVTLTNSVVTPGVSFQMSLVRP